MKETRKKRWGKMFSSSQEEENIFTTFEFVFFHERKIFYLTRLFFVNRVTKNPEIFFLEVGFHETNRTLIWGFHFIQLLCLRSQFLVDNMWQFHKHIFFSESLTRQWLVEKQINHKLRNFNFNVSMWTVCFTTPSIV